MAEQLTLRRVLTRCWYTACFLIVAPSSPNKGLQVAPHGYRFAPTYSPDRDPLDWWQLVPRTKSDCTCEFCMSHKQETRWSE